MTRRSREWRRRNDEADHGIFTRVPGFIDTFLSLFKRKRQVGVTVLTFAQWRAARWKDKLPPADELEKFQYRAYLDQLSQQPDPPHE